MSEGKTFDNFYGNLDGKPNMSAEAATIPVDVPADAAAPPKFSKKTILLLIGLFFIFIILFTFNKRIKALQTRNAEIVKMLKNTEQTHGPRKL